MDTVPARGSVKGAAPFVDEKQGWEAEGATETTAAHAAERGSCTAEPERSRRFSSQPRVPPLARPGHSPPGLFPLP